MMALTDYLLEVNILKTSRIIQAFRSIDRKDFVPQDLKEEAYDDRPLSIGWNQTISQPLVVAFMLEKLQPQSGDKILDIGSGSGWTTALLAEIVGKKGKIIAMEIIPQLAEFGQENVSKYNFIEKGIVQFLCSDGSKGHLEEAPFDKILASATAKEIPQAWPEQVKDEGRIVAPIGSSIWLFIKKKGGLEKTEFPGFLFVPLTNNEI